jgi:hypothetical protein
VGNEGMVGVNTTFNQAIVQSSGHAHESSNAERGVQPWWKAASINASLHLCVAGHVRAIGFLQSLPQGRTTVRTLAVDLP